MISRCCASALAALALIAGLACDVANAARQDGDYFEIDPGCCEQNADISNVLGLDLSTADVAITNGVLKTTTTSRRAIFSDGTTFWISSSRTSLWSAGLYNEALRKDFPNWPAYRVKLWYYPASVCTGYLAAYSSRGKLMVQKTFTSSADTVLDTGALKGRIGYILATFDGACGRLGKIGYYYKLH